MQRNDRKKARRDYTDSDWVSDVFIAVINSMTKAYRMKSVFQLIVQRKAQQHRADKIAGVGNEVLTSWTQNHKIKSVHSK